MATNNCISQLQVNDILYDIKDANARNILSGGFFEQPVYEDIYFKDVVVPEGKILTFIGYNAGVKGGAITTRFKNSSGAYGNVGPDLSFGYDEENEMIILNSEDDGNMILSINDEDSSMSVENNTLIVSSPGAR